MRIVCAWCNGSMGEKACAAGEPARESHGICPDCLAKTLAELAHALPPRTLDLLLKCRRREDQNPE